MRTESSYYDEHLGYLIGRVETRANTLEAQRDLSADDEMELSSLDRLHFDLWSLRGVSD